MTADKLLARMKDPAERASPTAVCVRYVWNWTLDGEPCTRAVNTLIRRKQATAMYFTGGRASLSPNLE